MAATDTDNKEALSLFMKAFWAAQEISLPCWPQSSARTPALDAAEALPLLPDLVANCFRNSATEVPTTPLNHKLMNRSI
jgi:hypothetical protein